MPEEAEWLAAQQENCSIAQTNPSWLDLSADWEQQPKFYDRPWETAEMIRDSSLRSE
jgi:hypothetical protein